MKDKAKAICYKDGKPVKTYFDIVKVETEDKYNYFVFYQKIYKHTIIFTKRYNEIDKVEVVSKGEFGKEIIKEIKPCQI